VPQPEPFVDIHCHLLPAVDDGATSWAETLAMARLAVSEGFSTIVATPHQLTNFVHVPVETIRERAAEVTRFLADQNVPLTVRPGAEVHLGPNTLSCFRADYLLSLGEHGRHMLIELPFESHFAIDDLLADLRARKIVPIMAHPERNRAMLAEPRHVADFVAQGVLMQLTSGSLTGSFGPDVQAFAEQLLADGLVHFVSTDAHGPRVRPPLMRAAFERVCDLAGKRTAIDLCCRHGETVASGGQVTANQSRRRKSLGWWPRRAAA
jgi:protein-tyrosine phosphatase